MPREYGNSKMKVLNTIIDHIKFIMYLKDYLKMKIKIAKPENELIGDSQLLKNLNSTFLSGNYIGGKNVQEFEDSLGNYLNVKYVASLNLELMPYCFHS